MGLALAAELNHHPGLVHVLEASEALDLAPAAQANRGAARGDAC
jgi:hypothetical protein